jgi:hypothetical protein
MTTTRHDDVNLASWMNTPEFAEQYAEWWRAFDEKLATYAAAEIKAAIADMAKQLKLPDDIATGMFSRELGPDRYAAFLAKRRMN